MSRRRAGWWRSAAWPDPADPPYLNGVAVVQTDRAPIKVLEALHAVERAFTERHAGHVADDDGDRRRVTHVQRGLERVVDAEDAVPVCVEASGELPQADRAVEDPRSPIQPGHLPHDHAEAMLVPRPEHLGLRAPRVSSGGVGHCCCS